MTKNIFLTADTHFGHSVMYKKPFKRSDGLPLRPWGTSEEADEAMIERWNAIVKPIDKIYHLGDVAMPRAGLNALERLNGDKVLIAGNHDVLWEKELRKHFRNIRPCWELENFILSHIPVHPDSLRNFRGNIHGHLHSGSVVTSAGCPDHRYLCVCVENTGYAPIAWEDVKQRFARR